jgi:Ca2+-binding EF-hand superfamily protein
MINEQVQLDQHVESAKNETVTRPDFNTFDAYRIFDIDNIGTITALDMKHGLQDIGVHVTAEDVNLFFERHDKDRDGRLDYREFAEALTPTDSYYASMLARRPSNHRRINVYRKDDVFAHSTAQSFKDLLRTMISTEGATEVTR